MTAHFKDGTDAGSQLTALLMRFRGEVVVLVDDGIVTGATVRATARGWFPC